MPDPVDELFLLPLREFTAARDRLAAQLVAAKQRDRARVVKALRRPTVAAWVVNQLAHRHAAAVRRLLDAGAVLRRAQYALGRRGSADDFRAATKRRQETLRELRALAAPLLREAGSAAHLDDVLATLEVASVDPAAAKAVTSGRLSRELPRPAGFGDTHDAHQLMLVPSGKGSPSTRAATEPKRTRAADVTAKRRGRERAAEARRLEQEAARSEQAAKRAAERVATRERSRGSWNSGCKSCVRSYRRQSAVCAILRAKSRGHAPRSRARPIMLATSGAAPRRRAPRPRPRTELVSRTAGATSVSGRFCATHLRVRVKQIPGRRKAGPKPRC